jgi:phage baseplate assembly protein W
MSATRSDRFTQLDKKNQVYSDFLTDLNPHPVSGDIVRYVNENAVIRSIKNLIQTNRGERLYQPRIGSDLRRMLFEPLSDASASIISTYIRETIDNHEPRARVIGVDATPYYEQNLYVVTIAFFVINKQDPVSFNLTLTRVR